MNISIDLSSCSIVTIRGVDIYKKPFFPGNKVGAQTTYPDVRSGLISSAVGSLI